LRENREESGTAFLFPFVKHNNDCENDSRIEQVIFQEILLCGCGSVSALKNIVRVRLINPHESEDEYDNSDYVEC
jgi:hypothetical protein